MHWNLDWLLCDKIDLLAGPCLENYFGRFLYYLVRIEFNFFHTNYPTGGGVDN